jgi:ATP-binding cassette subfamily F protein uup
MAQESNLLVLDEPTNDLDVETLDLLEELVADYAGTVLLVSHDRDFIDRIATTTIAMEGDGRAIVYAGGWSDYRAQRGEAHAPPASKAVARVQPGRPTSRAPVRRERMSFSQVHRLEKLPGEITRLGAEITKLSELLADPGLYVRAPQKFARASEALAERQSALATAEDEWLRLEELRETLEGDPAQP